MTNHPLRSKRKNGIEKDPYGTARRIIKRERYLLTRKEKEQITVTLPRDWKVY